LSKNFIGDKLSTFEQLEQKFELRKRHSR